MKKIVLNESGCIGCGACVGIDAEHFEFSDEGYSTVKSQENLESQALSDAIDACPVAVISIEDVTDVDDASVTLKSTDDDTSCEECECEDCHCKNEDSCCEDEKAA